MFVPLSERGYDEQRVGDERAEVGALCGWSHGDMKRALAFVPDETPVELPCLVELELPECGYWLDVGPSGKFVMRSAERVALGCFLDGRLTEVQGPVRAE